LGKDATVGKQGRHGEQERFRGGRGSSKKQEPEGAKKKRVGGVDNERPTSPRWGTARGDKWRNFEKTRRPT